MLPFKMLKVMGAPADSKSEQQTQNKANHEHYSTKNGVTCTREKLVCKPHMLGLFT